MEAVGVPHALDYAAHKDFDGARIGVLVFGVFTLGHVIGEPQLFSEFFLLETSLHVNLVSKNHKGHVLQLRHRQ